MEEAIASIKEARDQLRSEAANTSSVEASSYPIGIVERALQTARVADEPGLFDRSFYVKSVCSGNTDMGAFGGPFSDVYNRSDNDLDCDDLDPINDVINDVTQPDYVFQGRTRSRLRSGPYPIKKVQDETLISR